MSTSNKFQVTISRNYDIPDQPVNIPLSPREEFSINIQPNEDWTITGDYLNNVLRAITLKRIPLQAAAG